MRWPRYAETLEEARRESGVDESVISGAARTAAGAPLAVVASAFEFVGGSMGLATGERIVRAFDRACEERLPVLVVARSGGARLQEGLLALVQMARVADAARRHHEAGLLQVAYLESPTTGGVYASVASLADVVWAAPHAVIGFAGPRVVESTTGEPLAPGEHTAESARAAGIVDDVLDATAARAAIATVVDLAHGPRPPADALGPGGRGPEPATSPPPSEGVDAWREVLRARDPHRPSGRAWLDRLLSSRVELAGDRAGGVDPVVVTGLGRLAYDARPVAFVALDRPTADGRPRPAGYRTARRVIALAARLGLPLLTLVDTPGADPSADAEHGGIAGEIARTLAAVSAHPAPTVSLVVGEGGSGGALAFAATDRCYLLDGSVFAVIAPEGAAAILRRDITVAPDVAARLGLTAGDLVAQGVVNGVVGPHEAPAVISEAFGAASAGDGRARLDSATARWLHPGR